MRDYEVVKVEQEVPNEFLLVFDDGEPGTIDDSDGDGSAGARQAGAYYKLIERKMLLKKKRTEVRGTAHLNDAKLIGGAFLNSQSSASVTSGRSYASRTFHQVMKRPKSAPRRSRKSAIQCICYSRQTQRARMTLMAMRMQTATARSSSQRRDVLFVYDTVLFPNY